MHPDTDDGRDDRESLIVAIEQELARILTREYGIDDVQVRIDRQTGDIDCNYDLPADLKGRIFATAVKQAIIRRIRDDERGLG